MVERQLIKEGTSREAIGREEFLHRTWLWKEKYGGMITQQIRRLGASCDWTRERFTMDAGLSKAVREAFVRLYEKGLIYRGPRLINWSPGLKTAVSDLEVEYAEEPGTLYYFNSPESGSSTSGAGVELQHYLSPSPPPARRQFSAIQRWPCIPKMSATSDLSVKKWSCPCWDAKSR